METVQDKTDAALGRVVRRMREERGWSLRVLSEKVGLSYTAIASKERGNVRIRPHEKKKFAQAFGIDPHEFDTLASGMNGSSPIQPGDLPVLNLISGRVVSFSGLSLNEKAYQTRTTEHVRRADVDDPYAFALVAVDEDMAPAVRAGDILILSPVIAEGRAEYQVLPGEVVLVRTRGEKPVNILGRYASSKSGHVELTFDGGKDSLRIKSSDVERVFLALELRRRKF